ncbi:MAG: DUF1330 domain-containing protein [Burkholderiales bacterium]|nr:DUF1330 domain-containing protein [Burkholderiales bacterium]
MPAYVIAEIEITNPDGYREYTTMVPATIQQYGGRFIARGGKSQVLEGDWPERRRVIIEFPSVEAARKWWDSPEYAKPKALRRANSNGRLLLIESAS